jgi:tetrahydromethanopterin S-methyltransferase subunit C
VIQLVALAAALCAAGWQARAWRRVAKEGLTGAVPTA